MEYISHSEKETSNVGYELASQLKPGNVIAMYGDLGAGKTAFVRGLAEGLGLDARVSSPTFTIVNEYLGKIPLFHFDMYRLGDADELFEIGWEDYITRGGICVVEWSENVEEAFYNDTIRIYIEKIDDFSRKIKIEFPA
ncbi:MAG: tRNA (adenosine(37)-N6)-threonylcarbamoyltransferase complex ATPase subunit type 1 TsaE [Ruminococcaceae bacterium]|nr:tRNA (adenosine(37)-N6)-threonylcarbamoyltransferase complex ATPase subunit type 1 TsaE [Oscillospiraceae bacterium]